MSIIDSIKDTARAATNSVVDTAENMVNKPKSPKELAARVIEHLSHKEYTKIAQVLSEEAKKYASHLGIEDFALVEAKLTDFEDSMKDVATDLEEGDYSTVATKLKEVEAAMPDSMMGNTEIFSSLKSLLNDIVKVVEGYNEEEGSDSKGETPDFSKLQEIFEGYFNKMIS